MSIVESVGIGPTVDSRPRPNRWTLGVASEPLQYRFILGVVGVRAAGGRQWHMVVGI